MNVWSLIFGPGKYTSRKIGMCFMNVALCVLFFILREAELLTVRRRRQTGFALKEAAKRWAVGEPASRGDAFDGKVGAGKQFLGAPKACQTDLGDRRAVEQVPKTLL